MFIKILTFLAIISIGQSALAKNKVVYAKEALLSLDAYFNFAIKQNDFSESLTSLELNILHKLQQLLVTYEWSRFPEGGGYLKPFPLDLKFSSDTSLFKLKPNQPARSAITKSELLSPIFFNLNHLNRETTTYLDVVQLLIHELGHKLALTDQQANIDSLSIKIRGLLEGFYYKKPGINNYTIEFLSLPVEVQSLGFIGNKYLEEVNLFIENEEGVTKVGHNVLRDFARPMGLGAYIRHQNGTGNIVSNSSYVLKDVTAHSIYKGHFHDNDYTLELTLVYEVQSRLMYVGVLNMTPGAALGGDSLMRVIDNQVNLMPPTTRLVHSYATSYHIFNENPRVQVSFLNMRNKWTYKVYNQDITILNIHTKIQDEFYYVEIELKDDHPHMSSISLEVNTTESEYSYLAEGVQLQSNIYTFKIPQNIIPDTNSFSQRLIINNNFFHHLGDKIKFKKDKPMNQKVNDLKRGGLKVKVQNNSITELVPYDRRQIIVTDSSPLAFNISTNFKPAQVRLRWIKGTELEISREEGNIPAGRYSTISEETINPKNITITKAKANSDQLSYDISFTSLDVHEPQLIETYYPEDIIQKDKGFREIKEIILISEDGRMLHSVLSSSEKIYNQEYLKVPVSSCKSLLTSMK